MRVFQSTQIPHHERDAVASRRLSETIASQAIEIYCFLKVTKSPLFPAELVFDETNVAQCVSLFAPIRTRTIQTERFPVVAQRFLGFAHPDECLSDEPDRKRFHP